MSDETKKPFAEVVDSDLHGRPVLAYPGGSWDPVHWNPLDESDLASLRNAARRISEAVAAREAKLRGALAAIRDILLPVVEDRREAGPYSSAVAAHSLAHFAIEGAGPDYVPRAELDAANAKLKAYGAAVDLLDKHESLTAAEVCAWLEYAGLKKPPKPEEWSDGDLSARINETRREAAARNWAGGEVPRPRRACAHCNDMPYSGLTLACPECGIDRHGVGHGAG